MRLPDFILANVEPILVEWEAFAHQIWPGPLKSTGVDISKLRDHAVDILHATVRDMTSPQTSEQQSQKSKGKSKGNGRRGAGRFDVLVSDLAMPDRDGYDLIREVRRRGHHAEQLPAIALTGYAQPASARDAMSAGFQVHVPKPIDVPGLTATIASLVGPPRVSG